MGKEHQVPVYETSIDTLDEMLNGGIPLNSTVLITGSPGTGKTTLALQILAEATKKNISTAFLTFDESPDKAFDNFIRSYPCGLTNKDYFRTSPRKTKYLERKGGIRIVDSPEDWMKVFDPDLDLFKELQNPSDALERMFRQLYDCGIWFIDGVNVLLETIRDEELFARTRVLQQLIRKTFIENSSEFSKLKIHPTTPNIVIFTAEASSDRREFIYESYLADVIVRLKQKDFVPDPKFPGHKEKHLVCSVPKGRGVHVQRREVTYEFVPGEGIQFYPTYPATGMVSLFFENKRQKQLIDDFTDVDVPTLYPGLSVRGFHRSAILHEYAVRRRQDEIPKRYENYTSSLDEYWTRNLRPILAELPYEQVRPFEKDLEEALIPEILDTKKAWLFSEDSESIFAVPYLGNVGAFFVNRRTGIEIKETDDGTPYVTWEQIERYCRGTSTSRDTPQFCCEMKSIDSFTAFGLELCWSHSGGWYTANGRNSKNPLEVVFPDGQTEDGIILALERLQRWIHKDKLLRPYSTLQPNHRNCISSPDFARHWHSTRVESLLEGKNQDRASDTQTLPIPIPEWRERKTKKLSNSHFHSCWGEWYLGAWKGTENIRLVTEIINTITSSRWQINTAITGAGLPVFEPFFEEFGDSRCFGTSFTFREIREVLYAGAFSRARFSEYRFVMQRFYAALMTIVANPKVDVSKLWNETKARIENRD